MRILVAEDDAIMADGLMRSLRQSGYVVDRVETESGYRVAGHILELFGLCRGCQDPSRKG